MKVIRMLVEKMMKEEEEGNIMGVSDTFDRFHFLLFTFFLFHAMKMHPSWEEKGKE